MAALEVLQRESDRLHIDVDRIVLAGDSAGAQMSAQVAAIAANPQYAAQMDIEPTVRSGQLRGVVLCCGVFDPAKLGIEEGHFERRTIHRYRVRTKPVDSIV